MDRRNFLRSTGLVLASSAISPPPWLKAQAPPWKRLRIGIFSDEIDENFETALRWMRAQEIEWVEPRNLWGKYVIDLRENQVRRAKELLAKYAIRVSDIPTPFLKTTLPGTTPIPNDQMKQRFGNYPLHEHTALLLRAFDKARSFGTDQIRIFSYWRVPNPGEVFERLKARLVEAVEMAAKAEMRLLLENESACNVATASELAALLREIPSKHLSGLWDPGNALFAGEKPYPDGYEKLDRKRLDHIHMKDAMWDRARNRPRWMPIGRGEIDLSGQLGALVRDRYQGVVSIETHYIPKGGTAAQGSLESVTGLRRILQAF